MNKTFKTLGFLTLGFLVKVELARASALTNIKSTLQRSGDRTGLNTNIEPEAALGSIFNALFGFLGMIFVVLIIYGGFTWMTAGGNEEKVSQAKKIIGNSTIGLLVTILSYTITKIILLVLRNSGI